MTLAVPPTTQVLAAQRDAAPDLAALCSFNYSSLAGELQVGGVFVRVFNQRAHASAAADRAAAASGASGAASNTAPGTNGGRSLSSDGAAPGDAAGFCKALVRFLYERLVERCYRGMELSRLPADERVAVGDVLTALSTLLEQEPRLLGLLSSKSALSPLVAALAPAAVSWPPLMEQAAAAAGEAANEAAAAPGVVVAPSLQIAVASGSLESSGSSGQTVEQVGSSASPPSSDAPLLAIHAEQHAYIALTLLLRATQNAAVVEALVDDHLLRMLYWLLYQPPSLRVLQQALVLLRMLTSHAAAASVAGYQGGVMLLLNVLLHTGTWPWCRADGVVDSPSREDEAAVKESAAAVLSRLMTHPTHGPKVVLLLDKLLPPGLVASIKEGPPEAVLFALNKVTVKTPAYHALLFPWVMNVYVFMTLTTGQCMATACC